MAGAGALRPFTQSPGAWDVPLRTADSTAGARPCTLAVGRTAEPALMSLIVPVTGLVTLPSYLSVKKLVLQRALLATRDAFGRAQPEIPVDESLICTTRSREVEIVPSTIEDFRCNVWHIAMSG